MRPLAEQMARSPRRAVSLTPLIDVVFILLVFFMLAASLQRESALEVVPAVAADPADVPVDARVLWYDATVHGLRPRGDEPLVSAEGVADRVNEARDTHPDQMTVVALIADEGLSVQALVDYLSALEAEGVRHIRLVGVPST